MKIKETLITIAAIFVIFFVFLLVKESKKAGKNEIKIEQLEDSIAINEVVINNQKATNEVKIKQQKISSDTIINDEYRAKLLLWLQEDDTSNSK